MASEMGFTEKVLKSFKNITKEIEKVSTADGKIYINSTDFMEIKDKQTLNFVKVYLDYNSDEFSKVKDIKSRIINIAVPKSDAVLKEIVSKGSVDRFQIEEQTKKLEREIDDMVYELYGLNKKEIDIIEENLK